MYHFVFLLVFSPNVYGLEWSYQSLLQPGPCPNSVTLSSLDIHQLKGEWRIEQLSPLLSVCYRRPSFELVETAAQATPEMNNIPHWMEATFKWSTCLEEFVYQQMNSFNVRLWPNSISAGSFLLQLPSPLNLVGFSTLNFVSTDYKNYAAVYICHSLLLEHVLIPMIMVRPTVELDPTETKRLKWVLVNQGINSALGLSNVLNAECNDLAPNTEPSIIFENSTAGHIQFSSQSTSSDSFRFETSTIHDIMPAPKPSLYPVQTPVDSEAIDPDSEVEWITPNTKNDNGDGIQFPEPIELPNSKEVPNPIWPFIFMSNPRGNSKL